MNLPSAVGKNSFTSNFTSFPFKADQISARGFLLGDTEASQSRRAGPGPVWKWGGWPFLAVLTPVLLSFSLLDTTKKALGRVDPPGKLAFTPFSALSVPSILQTEYSTDVHDRLQQSHMFDMRPSRWQN